MRTAVRVLTAAACISTIAIAAPIGRGSARLQLAPADSRDSRETVSVRAQGAAGGDGDVAFDPPGTGSYRSSMGACASANGSNNANGVCQDHLPVTGNSEEKNFPIKPNGGEQFNEEEIWSDAVPGQSNEEWVTSSFVPDNPILLSELDVDKFGSTSKIDEATNIGEAPEPSTFLLMGGGLFALGYYRKRRMI